MNYVISEMTGKQSKETKSNLALLSLGQIWNAG